jgi:hypothetical protein
MLRKKQNINKLPTDGYVIFPISMSRIQGDQSPASCMRYLALLDKKIGVPGNDVIFLYTNGLYFNSREPSHVIRKRTNKQMLSHKKAMKKLILKKKKEKYMVSAFHFLPFDYVLLNSEYFEKFFDKLKEAYKKDKKFREFLIESLGKRKVSEENINFLLEEMAVGHIIREHLVDFQKSLVKKDTFRLIVYPGPLFKPEVYAWQKRILPQQNIKKLGRYYASYYNPKEKRLYNFDEITL